MSAGSKTRNRCKESLGKTGGGSNEEDREALRGTAVGESHSEGWIWKKEIHLQYGGMSHCPSHLWSGDHWWPPELQKKSKSVKINHTNTHTKQTSNSNKPEVFTETQKNTSKCSKYGNGVDVTLVRTVQGTGKARGMGQHDTRLGNFR